MSSTSAAKKTATSATTVDVDALTSAAAKLSLDSSGGADEQQRRTQKPAKSPQQRRWRAPPIAVLRSPSDRPLLVFDLNGVCCARVHIAAARKAKLPKPEPFESLRGRYVYRRPSLDALLDYAFEHFDVAMWSSAMQHNVQDLCSLLLGGRLEHVVFMAYRDHCTPRPRKEKPHAVLKDLTTIWADPSLPYNARNTIVLDDSPEKFTVGEQVRNLLVVPSFTHVVDEAAGTVDTQFVEHDDAIETTVLPLLQTITEALKDAAESFDIRVPIDEAQQCVEK